MNDSLKAVEIEGTEHVQLMVRNINGEGVIFTSDGKIIGHQISHMGFYYYEGREPNRVKMYRATFLVDSMASDVPNGDNQIKDK